MSRRAIASRPPGWRALAGVVAAGIAIAVVLAGGSLWSSSDAAPLPAGVTVTIDQTTDLVDGQRITVNLKAAADVSVSQLYVKQCRLGATYEVRDDVLSKYGNCPLAGVSSSADDVQIRDQAGYFVLAKQPEGLDVGFKVGVGATEWPSLDGTSVLTCGPADPCALVVRVRVSGVYHYSVTRLEFVDADPIAACGGSSAGIVSSGGSDEIQDAWASWTREYCKRPGVDGAVSTGTFGGGEGPAVSAFSSGLNDLVYTARGYDPDVGLIPSGAPTRPAVAVPVAVNAAVFATGSGRIATVDGLSVGKVKYPTLELKLTDAAALTTGGMPWVNRPDRPYKASILGLNPELGGSLFYGGGSFGTAGVYAQSLPLSSTWYLTQYFNTNAPTDFRVPGSDVLRPASVSFAQADPDYANDLLLVSGRPSLEKIMEGAFLDNLAPGPVWTITDLATAHALDMGLVALETSPGHYVEPNAETLANAVPTMVEDERGLLRPDPGAQSVGVAAAGDAYPLTYVIYALAPAEPLYTEDCVARSDSQQILDDWLTYITTEGQALLPDGLVALTPELKAQAADAIAQVGAAPVTGSCAGVAAAQAPGAAPPLAAPGSLAIPGALPSSALPIPPAAVPAGPVAAAGTSGDEDETIAAVPAFSRRRAPDTGGGVVALVGIALVSSLGVFLTARMSASAGGAFRGEGGFVQLGGRRGVLAVAVLWTLIAIVGVGLVVYQLGPMLHQREQAVLFDEYRQELKAAAHAGEGLATEEDDSLAVPPEIGNPVGIVEIPAIGTQEVVLEGIGPGETQSGPGHVPGTAGLGQPSNSVLVGRRNAFGGPFDRLGDLRTGDKIVVTTVQGQSVYVVRTVEETEYTEKLLDGSKDDRLTLVTSGSSKPLNASTAIVVNARMRDLPFQRTVQGARTERQTAIDSASGSWSTIALAVAVYLGVVVGSILVYRRFRFVVAYVLTIAPIVAATVLLAEGLSPMLPTWT